MFRKKGTEGETPGTGEGAFRRSGETAAPPDALRRRAEPPAGVASQAAGGAVGGTASATVTPTAVRPEPEPKRLIVGEGIRLSGEISSCDRLVVEGEVEVTLNNTLALEIASTGRFTGGCEVEEADISGVYEGDLTVRKRLSVRSTGKLTGTIRYAQLELERGGQIAGNVSVIDPGSEAPAGTTRPTEQSSAGAGDDGSKESGAKAS